MYLRGGWPATISYLCLTRAQRYPILSFAVGVLIGHLFWPQTIKVIVKPEEAGDKPADPTPTYDAP